MTLAEKFRELENNFGRKFNREKLKPVKSGVTSEKDTIIQADEYAIELLNKSLEKQGLPHARFISFSKDNEYGIPAGLYCQTSITQEVWDESYTQRSSYGNPIDKALKDHKLIKRDEIIVVYPEYATAQGKTLLTIKKDNESRA